MFIVSLTASKARLSRSRRPRDGTISIVGGTTVGWQFPEAVLREELYRHLVPILFDDWIRLVDTVRTGNYQCQSPGPCSQNVIESGIGHRNNGPPTDKVMLWRGNKNKST